MDQQGRDRQLGTETYEGSKEQHWERTESMPKSKFQSGEHG